jgi:hypothetical protein
MFGDRFSIRKDGDEALLAIYHLLLIEADTDELIDSDSVVNLFENPAFITLPLNAVKLLQRETYFPWTTINLRNRLRFALRTNNDAHVARLLLGPEPLHTGYFDVQTYGTRSYSLFSHIAGVIGLWYHIRIEDASWQAFLKEAISLKAHLITSEESLSPLAAFLDGLNLNHTNIGLSERPQLYWLQSLQREGADLVEYGRLEKRIAKASNFPLEISIRGSLGSPSISVHITSLTYGPEPEDWDVWFSWPLDECAGDFWHMVENPELFDIPGAWISD